MCLQALICVVLLYALLLCALLLFFRPVSATRAAICRPSPTAHCFFYTAAYVWAPRKVPAPFLLLPLPAEDAHSENIVYWLLCQNKKPHSGKEEGCWVRVMTQGVYAALFALAQRSCTSFPLQVGQELMNPHARILFPFANCNAHFHMWKPILFFQAHCLKVFL